MKRNNISLWRRKDYKAIRIAEVEKQQREKLIREMDEFFDLGRRMAERSNKSPWWSLRKWPFMNA